MQAGRQGPDHRTESLSFPVRSAVRHGTGSGGHGSPFPALGSISTDYRVWSGKNLSARTEGLI